MKSETAGQNWSKNMPYIPETERNTVFEHIYESTMFNRGCPDD
jgi:hypothetical protein